MKFKELCESISYTACVISVEKINDGYGDIRIVDGNKKYIATFNTPTNPKKFVPNTNYKEYLGTNLNLESYCYRSAVKKELLHSYAYPENSGAWFHMIYIPLEYEEDNLAYCLYIMDISNEFDSDKLSSAHNDIASKVLKTTLRLSNSPDFKKTLNKVIYDIREMCNASFCCILLIDEIKKELNVIAESRDINSVRHEMTHYIDDDFYDIVKSWHDTIGDSDCIIIDDKTGFNYIKVKNPKWYASLESEKIDSLVLFRLKSGNSLLGYIWVSDFKVHDTIKIKETLEITTFILGSEIGNYLLVNQLTELSSIDLLTGLFNRNEMNNYMDRLVDKSNHSIGLMFLDINGLKRINDDEGHLAGDQLIKRAANVLKSVFGDNPIFRAGGDEFVVIIVGVSKKELENYCSVIKEKAQKNNVSFAIGYSIKNNSNEILNALKEADENMYVDKRKYYKNN
ncbi:MAG: GGDEF domain-containing protein [Acholeplasmatales bacterium]|nr:GGDEF domain-containing protein [Acholeplasmatales bacterium]